MPNMNSSQLSEHLTNLIGAWAKGDGANVMKLWGTYRHSYGHKSDEIKLQVVAKGAGINSHRIDSGYVDHVVIHVVFDSQRLFSFELEHYPVCCAMVMCNDFKYNVQFFTTEKEVHTLMELLFRGAWAGWSHKFRRAVFNFVEGQGYKDDDDYYSFGDIIPIEETRVNMISYRHMYTWATSKTHQQLLTVNHNTDNIIHFVDCMWYND